MISTEIAPVVARFCDRRGPSHDELTLSFKQAGLGSADPGQHAADGVSGLPRVRRYLHIGNTRPSHGDQPQQVPSEANG